MSEEKLKRRDFIKGSALMGLTALLSGCGLEDGQLLKRDITQDELEKKKKNKSW